MTEITKDTCPICITESSVRSWVRCPVIIEKKKCDFACCRSCVKKYLLGQPDINPKCMSCGTRWTVEFLAQNTDEQFHNHDYRDYKAKLILQREKSLLPETQPYIAKIKDEPDLLQEQLFISNAIGELHSVLHNLTTQHAQLTKKLSEIKNLKNGIISDENEEKKKPKIRFIGHCPQPNCKGYLSDVYICGICKKKACRSCRLIEHPKTECDKNVVETVKLLSNDTKPCPKCHIPITKIDGCDQMYCLQCHTPFSWQTGAIETGRIHNPHYYDFLRAGGREPQREVGDVLCGGLNPWPTILKRIGNNPLVERTYQGSVHIRAVVLAQYRHTDNQNENLDLRIKFMIESIDEKKWISELKRRDKRKEKENAIYMVLIMYCDTVDDLLNNLSDCRPDEIKNIIEQIVNLQRYVNEEFDKISRRFNNKTPYFSKKGDFYDVGDSKVKY